MPAFGVSSMYEVFKLSKIGNGRMSSLLLDSEYGVKLLVPRNERHTIPFAIFLVEAAGCVLTDYLRQILREHEYGWMRMRLPNL